MIEILCMFLGIFLGMLMGVLPGLGATSLMLMLFPFLLHPTIDVFMLMSIYFGIVSSGQYYGSVSASVFGVLGEGSSLPAVQNGYPLTAKGRGAEVLVSASTASYIAAISSIAFTALLVYIIPDSFLWMMKGKVVFILLCFASVLLIATSGRYLLSTIALTLGIVSSLVGYDDFFEQRILTFGISQLDGGLPMFPIFCGLLIVPIAWENLQTTPKEQLHVVGGNIVYRAKLLLQYVTKPSVLRGTVIGFFSGFIPGMGYIVSSNIAATAERRWYSTTVEDDTRLNTLMSAEAANNAGSVSVLIPLLLLGLPIVSSEAIFMGTAELKGFSITNTYEWFMMHWPWLLTLLVIINTFNWIVAGVFFNVILSLYQSSRKLIYYSLIALACGMMMYSGWEEQRLVLNLLVFGITLPIGFFVTHVASKFIFIYGYFVSELIVDEAYRIIF